MTNDFRIWTPRTRWILRTSWTPDCFVSRKVRLLKIIKTDSVINITRAYTEIFPKTDTKKQHFLPKKDRYISVRCVILKAKHGVWKFFGKLYWNLFSLDKDSNINVITTSYSSKTPLTIFSTFKTVYRALKSVNQPSIMEKYPILHICRTAWFKIDSYIPKPETIFQLSGEMPLCIITTYFIWETSRFFTISFPPVSDRDEWFSNLDTEDALDFDDQLDSFSSVSRKVRLLKIIKTDSVINITRAYTEIFPKTDTKKTTLLTHQRQV